MSKISRPPGATRRTFLRVIPATLAAGAGIPLKAQPAPAGLVGPGGEAISKAALQCGEELAGIRFTDPEEELMLGVVRRNREFFEALRRVPVPADTEPAFGFRPPRPARSKAAPAPPAAAGRAPVAPRRPALPRLEVRDAVESLAFQPVTVLAEAVRSRQVTSTALTRMYLDRLKTHGQRLEAVVTLTEELGLAQAAEADREIAAGRYKGPLHGMPWGVKDLFATRGIRTTWGAKPYEHQMIDTDATTIVRLRDAGAVLVAKLTTGELARGNVWFGGRTTNPWGSARSSGGSSAGPGAATAGGLVGFTIGTATGGSIVQPASMCGAVGLQPTYGRVSRHGVMTLRWTLDRVGPICRSVEDCMLVLAAIAGPDGHDETVADLPMPWDPDAPLGGLRIGYVARMFEEPPAGGVSGRTRWPAQRAVLHAALDVFRKIGRVEPVTLPDLPADALYGVIEAEAGASFDDLVRSGGVAQLAGKGVGDRANTLRASRFIPAVEYIRAQRVRTLLIRAVNEIFTRCDVILSPPELGVVRTTSLTGHPCITLKSGFVDGMPEGILLTGRLYDEGAMARVALAYEQATEWKARHPQMS
jgi:Asp-tRNA(Asn)/Glu-tRNA(Gln) amidotransferase A subunit family amidase